MMILASEPGRESCPVCRSYIDKVGFFLLDDQGIRQFRCQLHTLELLRLALQPLQTIAQEM